MWNVARRRTTHKSKNIKKFAVCQRMEQNKLEWRKKHKFGCLHIIFERDIMRLPHLNINNCYLTVLNRKSEWNSHTSTNIHSHSYDALQIALKGTSNWFDSNYEFMHAHKLFVSGSFLFSSFWGKLSPTILVVKLILQCKVEAKCIWIYTHSRTFRFVH